MQYFSVGGEYLLLILSVFAPREYEADHAKDNEATDDPCADAYGP